MSAAVTSVLLKRTDLDLAPSPERPQLTGALSDHVLHGTTVKSGPSPYSLVKHLWDKEATMELVVLSVLWWEVLSQYSQAVTETQDIRILLRLPKKREAFPKGASVNPGFNDNTTKFRNTGGSWKTRSLFVPVNKVASGRTCTCDTVAAQASGR
jgi:hypothetical protein